MRLKAELPIVITTSGSMAETNAKRDAAVRILEDASVFPSAAPAHLYHYTNIKGLRGILETQK
jgi:hypothetical protein